MSKKFDFNEFLRRNGLEPTASNKRMIKRRYIYTNLITYYRVANKLFFDENSLREFEKITRVPKDLRAYKILETK